MRRGKRRARTAQGGFAYLALLISIAIIGVAAAGTIQLGAIYQRRVAEKELLYVGGEFQRALPAVGGATGNEVVTPDSAASAGSVAPINGAPPPGEPQ